MGSHVTAPGEQLGIRCLAQGHLSRGIEGGESAGYSLPPPTIPAGPEIRTHNLPVTSPTCYPLGHELQHMNEYQRLFCFCVMLKNMGEFKEKPCLKNINSLPGFLHLFIQINVFYAKEFRLKK